MSRENTFPEDLISDDDIETDLVRLTARVCQDLRGDGLVARTITIKLRDHDFRTRQTARTLAEPVSTDRVIVPVALELLATFEPVLIPDVEADADCNPERSRKCQLLGAHSLMKIPLRLDGGFIGALIFISKTTGPSALTMRLVRLLQGTEANTS